MQTAPPNWIAKDCLDVGLFTNNLETMLSFWQSEIGLSFDHMLPVGGGVRQYRHDYEGAVLKLNHARDPLQLASAGGYRRLIIGRDDVATPKDLTDPDGNHVQIVPRGTDGIDHWAIEVSASDLEQFVDHYHGHLGLPRDAVRPDAVRCGRSLIVGVVAPETSKQTGGDEMRRLGFRYTTIQVGKVDSVHAAAIRNGADQGAAPQTLGKTARISFLKDACGNWMELSQRASITGSLAPG